MLKYLQFRRLTLSQYTHDSDRRRCWNMLFSLNRGGSTPYKDAPLCHYGFVHGHDAAAWNHMIRRHNVRRDIYVDRAIGISAMGPSCRKMRLFPTDWLEPSKIRLLPPVWVCGSGGDHQRDSSLSSLMRLNSTFIMTLYGLPVIWINMTLGIIIW